MNKNKTDVMYLQMHNSRPVVPISDRTFLTICYSNIEEAIFFSFGFLNRNNVSKIFAAVAQNFHKLFQIYNCHQAVKLKLQHK